MSVSAAVGWVRVCVCGGMSGMPAEAGGAHVDLGAEAQAGGPAVAVEVEDHPLALAEHPEDRADEGVRGQVVLLEVGVAEHHAVARCRGRTT